MRHFARGALLFASSALLLNQVTREAIALKADHVVIYELIETNFAQAKLLALNSLMSLLMLLKALEVCPSITFLEYFSGIGLFQLFLATINIRSGAATNLTTCYSFLEKPLDLVNISDCRKEFTLVSLVSLSVLCIVLAVLDNLLVLLVIGAR